MIPLDTLIPMQDVLRENKQIPGMIQFIQEGNFWTEELVKAHADLVGKRYGIIYIARFPDGKLMIHDGHHRCAATYLGNRHFLRDDECQVVDWTYEDYDAVWWDRGYVTPFDPKTEVRLSDFMAFKAKALEYALHDKQKALDYIYANKHLYARPRQINTLAELAETYNHVK